MKKYCSFLPLVVFVFLFSACKKETEVYKPARTLNDYYPLETGKYITYKLDSIVYLSFGQRDTTISYEVKYVVDSLLTDNLNRPAYRIFRFIRKNVTDAWAPFGTDWAINTKSNLEYVENNMRFVKLEVPIQNGTTWKGNEYIETTSSNSSFQYLNDWDFVYDAVGAPETIGNYNLDNTLTVNQRDEIIGMPDDPASYSQVNIGQEKYAFGIGLVYRKFFHSEYQPGSGIGDGYIADGSYGVTFTMIDHN